jgi:hypothetical protein
MKVPLRHMPCWPRGASLSFKLDAPVQVKYMFARGTDVVRLRQSSGSGAVVRRRRGATGSLAGILERLGLKRSAI